MPNSMIEKLPKCRIKLTLKCDRACSYCINKSIEYRKRWTSIEHLSTIDYKNYRSFIISGGEPTILGPSVLVDYMVFIRRHTGAPIYLQTNGALLTKSLVKQLDDYIDAIGYSVHDIDEFIHLLPRLRDISRIKPIQLYVEDKIRERIGYFTEFTLRVWTGGEFDPGEKIFVLT